MIREKKPEGSKHFFGIYHGRSGLMDLAAFCGVNCFFWDDPLARVAWADSKALTSLGTVGRMNALDGQIPQCLRSMGLCPLMSVDLPEMVPTEGEPIQHWHEIRVGGLLSQWLEGGTKGTLYPKAPTGEKWIVCP